MTNADATCDREIFQGIPSIVYEAITTVDTYPHLLGRVIESAGYHDVLWAASTRLSLPAGVSVLTACSARLLYPCSSTVEEIDDRYGSVKPTVDGRGKKNFPESRERQALSRRIV